MKILTEKELANELCLSCWTVRRMRLQENAPHFTVGKRIFYNYEHVCQWLEQKEAATTIKSGSPLQDPQYGQLRQIN